MVSQAALWAHRHMVDHPRALLHLVDLERNQSAQPALAGRPHHPAPRGLGVLAPHSQGIVHPARRAHCHRRHLLLVHGLYNPGVSVPVRAIRARGLPLRWQRGGPALGAWASLEIYRSGISRSRPRRMDLCTDNPGNARRNGIQGNLAVRHVSHLPYTRIPALRMESEPCSPVLHRHHPARPGSRGPGQPSHPAQDARVAVLLCGIARGGVGLRTS